MIKFTGDLRCDFDKAAAEIVKLRDRILGYQEQISSLRDEAKRLRKKMNPRKQNLKALWLKKMPL